MSVRYEFYGTLDLYLNALQRQNHAHITTHAVDLNGQLDLHVDQTGFTQLCPVCRTTSRLTQIPGFMKPGKQHIVSDILYNHRINMGYRFFFFYFETIQRFRNSKGFEWWWRSHLLSMIAWLSCLLSLGADRVSVERLRKEWVLSGTSLVLPLAVWQVSSPL